MLSVKVKECFKLIQLVDQNYEIFFFKTTYFFLRLFSFHATLTQFAVSHSSKILPMIFA